jgi:hypothetical protein
LDEHASDIITQRISFIFHQYSVILASCLVTVPTSGTAAGWRQSWVLLLPAKTSGYFFLVIFLFITFIIVCLGKLVIVVVLGTMALARLWQVGFAV